MLIKKTKGILKNHLFSFSQMYLIKCKILFFVKISPSLKVYLEFIQIKTKMHKGCTFVAIHFENARTNESTTQPSKKTTAFRPWNDTDGQNY